MDSKIEVSSPERRLKEKLNGLHENWDIAFRRMPFEDDSKISFSQIFEALSNNNTGNTITDNCVTTTYENVMTGMKKLQDSEQARKYIGLLNSKLNEIKDCPDADVLESNVEIYGGKNSTEFALYDIVNKFITELERRLNGLVKLNNEIAEVENKIKSLQEKNSKLLRSITSTLDNEVS